MFFVRFFIFFTMLVAGFSSMISASCGLQGCPRSIGELESGQAKWLVQPSLQYVKFDIDHQEGHYTMFAVHAHYYGVKRWILGGMVSLVGLDEGHNSHTGAGNPVLFGEYQLLSSPEGKLSVGTQLELPLGDDEHGIAADHTEIIPYVSIEKPACGLLWDFIGGFRTSTEEDEHHHRTHTSLFVNPHGEKEWLYRVAAAHKTPNDQVSPKVYLDGQHVVDGDEEGTGYLTAGASANFRLGKNHGLETLFEVPVTSPHRIEWRFGINMNLRI